MELEENRLQIKNPVNNFRIYSTDVFYIHEYWKIKHQQLYIYLSDGELLQQNIYKIITWVLSWFR